MLPGAGVQRGSGVLTRGRLPCPGLQGAANTGDAWLLILKWAGDGRAPAALTWTRPGPETQKLSWTSGGGGGGAEEAGQGPEDPQRTS